MYSVCVFFFFKQKTAYEMRISDWSSDVCSSDLTGLVRADEDGRQIRLDPRVAAFLEGEPACPPEIARLTVDPAQGAAPAECLEEGLARHPAALLAAGGTAMVVGPAGSLHGGLAVRSEERRLGTEGVGTCRYRGS